MISIPSDILDIGTSKCPYMTHGSNLSSFPPTSNFVIPAVENVRNSTN